MGSLTNVGFLNPSTGMIANCTRSRFVDDVTRNMGLGNITTILGAQFPIDYEGSPQVASIFDSQGDIDAHRQKYESWHKLNIDTILQGIADILDQIPPIGIAAKIIPYFDPFQPIIDVLNLLKDSIGQFIGNFDVLQFLTENFTSLLFDAAGLISDIVSISVDFFNNVKEALDKGIELLLNFIVGKILPKLGKTQREITEIYVQILGQLQNKEFKNSMLASLRSLVNTIINAPNAITVPEFSISSLTFNLDLPNDGPVNNDSQNPGAIIAYSRIISIFFDGVATLIQAAGDWILKITQGLDELLAYLIESLVQIGTQAIKTVYPEIEKSVGLASTLIEIIKRIIQMTIVTVLGYLLGPGIITLTVASLVDLLC